MSRPMTEAGKLRRQISLNLDDASDLRRTINEVMLSYGLAVDSDLQGAIDNVSEKALEDLKARSEANGWKKYAKGWVYESKQDKKGIRRNVLYNKKYGSLTHLLENGHEKILWGKNPVSVGTRVAGVKHIEPVNKMIEEELPKEVEKVLSGYDK